MGIKPPLRGERRLYTIAKVQSDRELPARRKRAAIFGCAVALSVSSMVAASVGFTIGLGNVSAFIKGSETISVQSV